MVVCLVHPALQQLETKERSSQSMFEELIQTVDVQWPAEDAKFWEVTSVKISHPPREDQEDRKTPLLKVFEQQGSAVDLDGWIIPRQCAMCDKEVSADASPRCSRCKAVIYCGHV